MQNKDAGSVVGVFTDLDQAQKVVKTLQEEHLAKSVRLIENDFDVNSEMVSQSNSQRKDDGFSTPGHKGGVYGFFARLFGQDDDEDESRIRLDKDSESYFKDRYQQKHHFVVIDNPQDPLRCRQLLLSYGAIIDDRTTELYEQGKFGADREDQDQTLDDAVMELREEQLSVGKKQVQTGEVHIRKEIVQETKTVEIPLVREELVIERRPITGAAKMGDLESISASGGEDIRIAISEEQVTIEKKVVPREEIRISKERITELRKVSEELRHEEAMLEEEGRVAMSASERAKLNMAKAKTKSNVLSNSTPKSIPDDHQPGL